MSGWESFGTVHWHNGQKDIPHWSGSTSTAHVYWDRARDVVGVRHKVSNRKSKIFDVTKGSQVDLLAREKISQLERFQELLETME